MIAFLIVVGLIGSISILAMTWVWVSFVAGWCEATPLRALAMLWLLLLSILFLGLGLGSDYGMGPLHLALWPVSILYLLSFALDANLFIFLCATFVFLALVCGAVAIMPNKAKLPTIIVGAVLTMVGPVALQNTQVQWQMTRYAKASGLHIIERSSLFSSIRERSDGYQPPHGVACDKENWPYLWSYQHRDWIALPPNTRYGGDTPRDVMSVCVHR